MEFLRVKMIFLSHIRLNDYNDSTQNSRGLYAASNGTVRAAGRQANDRIMPEPSPQDKRSKVAFNRSAAQATSPQLSKGSSLCQEGPSPVCQLINRKARTNKQLDTLAAAPGPQGAFCSDEADFANLIGAMDNDLERPESHSGEAVQEQSSQSVQHKGMSHQAAQAPCLHSFKHSFFFLLQHWNPKGSCRRKQKVPKRKDKKRKNSP